MRALLPVLVLAMTIYALLDCARTPEELMPARMPKLVWIFLIVVAIGIGPHEARVLRVISDLNSTVLLLRPAGTADAPLLRAVAPKDAQVRPGRTVHFSLQTDKCLCYNT